jgi:hypothetical protein
VHVQGVTYRSFNGISEKRLSFAEDHQGAAPSRMSGCATSTKGQLLGWFSRPRHRHDICEHPAARDQTEASMPFSGLIKSQYADSGTRSEPAAPLSSTDRCATRYVRCLGLKSTQIVASELSPDSESIPASEDFKASGKSPRKLMPLLNFDTNFSACCRGTRKDALSSCGKASFAMISSSLRVVVISPNERTVRPQLSRPLSFASSCGFGIVVSDQDFEGEDQVMVIR